MKKTPKSRNAETAKQKGDKRCLIRTAARMERSFSIHDSAFRILVRRYV
jgi:hypothetical protein